VQSLPSLRLTAHLNAVLRFRIGVAEATAAVLADDVAHHVVDPDDLLGLDPVAATPLSTALPVIAAREPEMWVLALPVPGAMAPLRGPAELNLAAVEVGEAVVAAGGGLALVPHAVGRGVQWRAFRAPRRRRRAGTRLQPPAAGGRRPGSPAAAGLRQRARLGRGGALRARGRCAGR
jgi:hypothetical protein